MKLHLPNVHEIESLVRKAPLVRWRVEKGKAFEALLDEFRFPVEQKPDDIFHEGRLLECCPAFFADAERPAGSSLVFSCDLLLQTESFARYSSSA